MPIFIDELSTQVTMHSGEIPLTPAQLNQITEHVLRRLAERQRDEHRNRMANGIRTSVMPHTGTAGGCDACGGQGH
jgi:hypothetical protein